jgi:hypothetical protein
MTCWWVLYTSFCYVVLPLSVSACIVWLCVLPGWSVGHIHDTPKRRNIALSAATYRTLRRREGWAVAQAAVRVRAKVRSCGICAIGQVFSEYLGCTYQFAFYRLLHVHQHLSSGAGKGKVVPVLN